MVFEYIILEYIKYYLINVIMCLIDNGIVFNKVCFDVGFWVWYVDILVWFIGFGFFFLIIFRSVVLKVIIGVFGKMQVFVELVVEFVDDNVKSIFYGKSVFIVLLVLIIFVWVLLMNFMDLVLVDLILWVFGFIG